MEEKRAGTWHSWPKIWKQGTIEISDGVHPNQWLNQWTWRILCNRALDGLLNLIRRWALLLFSSEHQFVSICRYLLLTCSFEWPFTSQHTLINMDIKQNIGSHWVLSFFFHQEFHWRMRLKLNEQLRLYRKWIGNTILGAIHKVSFVCITVICTASWFR